MCLITFAYGVHKKYRLILSANRDEFFNRPTAPLNIWKDNPEIIGGRDLQQGGTWMASNRNGRILALLQRAWLICVCNCLRIAVKNKIVQRAYCKSISTGILFKVIPMIADTKSVRTIKELVMVKSYL